MLSREARPQTWSAVAGQEMNIKLLRSLVKNPSKFPKSLIFQGSFGSGKTTSARILAKALNCKHTKDGEPCGNCPTCQADLESVTFYSEYDSSIIGNVDRIRELRDTFYHTSDGYRVIVFDECHTISPQAQTALLKVLEDSDESVFFIFCTTHADKLLPTIRSRSLEFKFETVPAEKVVQNLKEVAEAFNIEVTDDILQVIAVKSRGHMRNAHMLLDQYSFVGREDFLEMVKTPRKPLFKYFQSLVTRDTEQLKSSIIELGKFPLADIQPTFTEIVKDISSSMVGIHNTDAAKKLQEQLGPRTLTIVRHCIADWVQDAFKSDATLQCALLAIYQLTEQTSQTQTRVPQALANAQSNTNSSATQQVVHDRRFAR